MCIVQNEKYKLLYKKSPYMWIKALKHKSSKIISTLMHTLTDKKKEKDNIC